MSEDVIVVGGTLAKRKQVTSTIKSVLNSDISRREKKNIGVVYTNLDRRLPNQFAADSGSVPLMKGVVNGNRRTMTDIRIAKGLNKNDLKQSVLHELVHVNRKLQGGGYKNERKIDLEVTGRLPGNAIPKMKLGYYFSPSLKFPPGTSLNKKIALVRKDIVTDRRSLTGSVQKSMEGNVLERRVDAAYKKSRIACRKGYR